MGRADKTFLNSIWHLPRRRLSAAQLKELPHLEERLRELVSRGDPAAMTSLAYVLLRFRNGTPGEIGPLIRRAAKEGEPAAQLRLAATLQERGRHREALPWLERSATQGMEESLFRLGYLLVRPPRGVKPDLDRGIALFRSAHRKRHPLAAGWLAATFDGLQPPDRRAAYRWYRVAAAQGDLEAMHNLAVCYENGEGARKNLELARKWYALAAKAGVRNSRKSLDRVLRKLR